jgi:hypothetical protein
MTARDTFNTSVSSNHTTAEHAGISGLPGASPPGNATTWSRDVARAALANGTLTQSAYIDALRRIAGWEQSQNSLAKAILRAASDLNPV